MPILSIENLRVRYGRIRALDGVSISLEKGEIVAVLGPNGAGKSSLLLSIMGIVRPEADSRVAFDGQSIAGKPPEYVSNLGIALVPENRRIFTTLTVEENLKVGAQGLSGTDYKRRVDSLVELFPGLARHIKARAARLSGGEQQQLAIARALMSDPQVLMMDEPSLGLAPIVIEAVFRTIERLRQEGKAILLVEQMIARAVRIADHVHVLNKGRVTFSGTGDQARAAGFDSALATGLGPS